MEKNNKYNDILTATQKLFFKYGIKKVTIEDICKDANVSKMTFYKFFPNKMELAKILLDKIFEHYYDIFEKLMESDISFSEKMRGIVQMKLDYAKDANWDFIVDIFKKQDDELGIHIQKWIRIGLDKTVAYFVEAQKKGFMRKDLHPTMLLMLLDKMQEVALDDRVLAAYPNAQELTKEITKFFLYGISDER